MKLKRSLIFPFFLYLFVVSCLCVRPVHGLTLLSSCANENSNNGSLSTSGLNGVGVIVKGNGQYLAQYHGKVYWYTNVMMKCYVWNCPNGSYVPNGVNPVTSSSQITVTTSGFAVFSFDCAFQLAKDYWYAIIPMLKQNYTGYTYLLTYSAGPCKGALATGYYWASSNALLYGKSKQDACATHYVYTTDVFGGWNPTVTNTAGSSGGVYVGGGVVAPVGIMDYLVMFFVVFMPACLLGSAVKQNRLAGLLAGLCLGVGMGVLAGIIPFYMVFLIALLIAVLLFKGRF